MAQARLPFEYEEVAGDDAVTSFGGLPLLAEAMDAFGLSDSLRRNVKLVRRRAVKFDSAATARAVILTMAMGGDCFDDIERLREDLALARLLNAPIPAPETVRQWLYEFHDETLIESAKATATPKHPAYIPEESELLKGLGRAAKDLVAAIQKRWPQSEATLDIDATIQESHKREAMPHYLHGRGYQPVLAYWKEQELIVFEQFRDGNVPASMRTLALTKAAFGALPEGLKVRRLRGDTAMYSSKVIEWCSEQGIEYTIGCHTRKAFEKACLAKPEAEWSLLEERPDTLLHVACIEYVPKRLRGIAGFRFFAVRMTPRQDELTLEKKKRHVVHYGVISNRKGEPPEVIRWYWGKAGTIERVHDVIKNELGAGVLPCGRFGSNAAWVRLAAMTFNLLRVIRAIGPPLLKDARPKRLRLHFFSIPATLARHARKLLSRVAHRIANAVCLSASRKLLWASG